MTEEEKSSGMEELKSEVKICLICKVGRVGPVTRSKDRVDLVIYGRNVMRLARHVESRCRVHGCRAGYYYDYITYKGYTIYEDTALQMKKVISIPPLRSRRSLRCHVK